MAEVTLLVGGYGEVLTRAVFDPKTRALRSTPIAVAPGVSFYAQTPTVLLGVQEAGGATGGELVAIDPVRGDTRFSVTTCGASPCHLAIDPKGEYIAVANYSGSTMAIYRWPRRSAHADSGAIAAPELIECVEFTGSGPDHERQEKPHPHGVLWSPDGAFLYLTDLGTDRISWFARERWSQHASADRAPSRTGGSPTGSVSVSAGSGPRHAILAGDHFYVVNELSLTVSSFLRDRSTGALDLFDEQPTAGGDHGPDALAAEIVLHPSGKWVYASNRGPDTIAVFSRETSTGQLEPAGSFACGGSWPRHFSISADGSWLFVAHERSDSAAVFELDLESGLGTLCALIEGLAAPSWIAQA